MYKYYLLLLIALSFYSCSNTRYLPEGELLYTGGKVKLENKIVTPKKARAMQTELAGLLRPKPNKKIIGLRLKLYVYNLVGTG